VVALVLKETGEPVRIPQQQPVMILGRNDPIGKVYPDVDLTPYGGATLGVSRRHARLFFENGKLFIDDLKSTNLTRVNGEPLTPGEPHALQSGDEIRLGRLTLMMSIV
jgi:pSer/pThr/pTyr-binding forkhead associated (FHA) protein